jgi:HSP20 family protein
MGNSPGDMMKELNAIQRRVNKLFDDFRLQQSGRVQDGTWLPAADVYETDGAIVVKVEVPEVLPEDVDISLSQNILTLRGERRPARNRNMEQYHRVERSYGIFTRVFSLPVSPDPEGVTAQFDDGVLTVMVPKTSGGGKILVG